MNQKDDSREHIENARFIVTNVNRVMATTHVCRLTRGQCALLVASNTKMENAFDCPSIFIEITVSPWFIEMPKVTFFITLTMSPTFSPILGVKITIGISILIAGLPQRNTICKKIQYKQSKRKECKNLLQETFRSMPFLYLE